MQKSKVLPGAVFGKLTVIEKDSVRKKAVYWKCICECGKETVMASSNIPRNKGCGCQRGLKGKESPNWKGNGEMSAAFVTKSKIQAKRRGIDWELSAGDLWDVYEKQGGLCAISGVPLKFPTSFRGMFRAEGTASIDRKDSSLPYLKSNIQWVHKIVNMMKQQLSDADFVSWCCTIASHQKGKLHE